MIVTNYINIITLTLLIVYISCIVYSFLIDTNLPIDSLSSFKEQNLKVKWKTWYIKMEGYATTCLKISSRLSLIIGVMGIAGDVTTILMIATPKELFSPYLVILPFLTIVLSFITLTRYSNMRLEYSEWLSGIIIDRKDDVKVGGKNIPNVTRYLKLCKYVRYLEASKKVEKYVLINSSAILTLVGLAFIIQH